MLLVLHAILAAPQLLKVLPSADISAHDLCQPDCCLSAKSRGFLKARALNCDPTDDAQLWTLDSASGSLYNNLADPLQLYMEWDMLLVEPKGGVDPCGGSGWSGQWTYSNSSKVLLLSDADGPYCLYAQFGAKDCIDQTGYVVRYLHLDAPHLGKCGDENSQWLL